MLIIEHKKKAFFVVGPESSGTRVLTRLLIAAGCHGDGGHFQKFDNNLDVTLTPIVWRRSVPHGTDKSYPNVEEFCKNLIAKGYDVTALVIVRNWLPNYASQIKNEHASGKNDALKRIHRAMICIYHGLYKANVQSHTITYDSLMNINAVRKLMEELNLNPKADFETIRDEESKYYTF